MAIVYSKNLEVFNAKRFKNSVSQENGSNLYLAFGKCYPWTDDNNPPLANTSASAYYELWDNMIAAKKLTGNDVRHCVPRFDWASGEIYSAYDNFIDSKDLMSPTNAFYVVTDDWNVYKCLSNNYGALSTSKPTSISTTTDFQTSDGYIWKYMYTVTSEEKLRFITDKYIPVKTLLVDDGSLQWGVQNNAISGAIHSIILTDNGNSYEANDVAITITGDGSLANAYAIRNIETQTLKEIIIDNKGLGYTYADVVITSATGTGAAARAILSPIGGHGSNPLFELGGSNLVLNVQFKSDEEGKFPVTNEYRQVSLIEDPRVYKSSVIMANSVASQTTVLTLQGTSAEFVEDENVYQGTSMIDSRYSGKIVEWDSSNNQMKITNVRGTPTSELLTGETSGAARFITSITNHDMEPYSGNLLYIDNIKPIARTIDQTEDFKIILNF